MWFIGLLCKSEITKLYEDEMQQGWMKTDLKVLEPLWSCGDVLPTSQVDLRDASDREADDQADHEEHDENCLTVSMKVMSEE